MDTRHDQADRHWTFVSSQSPRRRCDRATIAARLGELLIRAGQAVGGPAVTEALDGRRPAGCGSLSG